jgi:transposase-like protein
MVEISYHRHRFPPVIIRHAVWLYLRFTLSYRDIEELLAERGLDISYEAVPCWVLKFGPVIARRLRRCRPRPSNRWHLDEMVVRIAGERMYLCVPSTTKARSSTCWFSVGATLGRRCD